MQEMIDVTIERDNDSVVLVFNFEKAIKMNLTSENQEEIKSFFQKLLAKIFDDFVSFQKEYYLNLKDEDEKDLFHDVSAKYVSNLNTEIQSIYAKLN